MPPTAILFYKLIYNLSSFLSANTKHPLYLQNTRFIYKAPPIKDCKKDSVCYNSTTPNGALWLHKPNQRLQIMNKDITIEITNKFIEAIEGGLANGRWERPWTINSSFPINPTTDKPYRGMNALLLMLIGGGHYAGYGQWKKIGAQVRTGEHGIMILAPIFVKTGKKALSGRDELFLKGFRPVKVFSALQVEGYTMPKNVEHDTSPIQAAAAVAKASGAVINYGGDRAFYSPAMDCIQMPLITQFKEAVDFHSTEVHELAHWTGHSTRLDRKLNTNRFGSEAYAFEELVAELTSSFVCAELGLHQGYQANHAKYLRGWLEVLRNDSKAILTASGLAATAADALMGRVDMKGNAIKRGKKAKAA
jgi:antirestriction protein ArdC